MSLRIRWSQAGAVLLVGALVLLALRVAPSLLRAPEPPPVPADVGLPQVEAAPVEVVSPKRAPAGHIPSTSIRNGSKLTTRIVSPSTRANAPFRPHRPRHHPRPKLQKNGLIRAPPVPPPMPEAPPPSARRQNPDLLRRRWLVGVRPALRAGVGCHSPRLVLFRRSISAAPAGNSPPKKLSGEGHPTPAPPRANQPNAAIVPRRFGSPT